ncbi:MAG: YraN family protein [Rhodospirillales bacterium]|nr:YraN family protein [Alphaproteobacteria bacterium]MCB9982022.1 YraN family protein [Rhodospirillales bacterium]
MSRPVKEAAYQRGVAAEQVAARYLQRQGYKILEQRYKTRVGEIDLIVRRGEMLVFVEVKAHKDPESALYAVTPRTRRRIEAAAGQYLADHEEVCGFSMRFDVIVVPPESLAESLKEKRNLLGADRERLLHHLDNAWLSGQ